MIAGSHGWLLLVGSVLAGAAGFCICSILRRRLLYDLHKIPGPAGWPLLGNALDMLGPNAFYFHQVPGDDLRRTDQRRDRVASSASCARATVTLLKQHSHGRYTLGSLCLVTSQWPVQLLADWTEKYGQVFVYHLGTQPVLAVTDPEEVARFCNNSNKQANLPKWSKIYLVTEPVSFGHKSDKCVCLQCTSKQR